MSAEDRQQVPSGKELGEALGQGILVLVEGVLKYFQHTDEGMRRRVWFSLLTVLDPCAYCYLKGKVCDRPVGNDREENSRCAWCAHTRNACVQCEALEDVDETERLNGVIATLQAENNEMILTIEEMRAEIEKMEEEDAEEDN